MFSVFNSSAYHWHRTAFSAGLSHRDLQSVFRLFRKHGLNDVVLIGGLPRDILLGQPPRDLDFTFLIDLSAEEKALIQDRRTWNDRMGAKVASRLAAVACALNVTADALANKGVRIRIAKKVMDLQYSGPFPQGSSYGVLHAADDGKNYRTESFFSVNTLGLLPNGRWIGDPEGFEDVKTRRIRLMLDDGSILPSKVLRFVYLCLRHRLKPTTALAQTLARFADDAKIHPQQVAAQLASKNDSMQRKLSFLFERKGPAAIVALLNRTGLTEPLLLLQGPGSDYLRTHLKTV